MKTEELKELGLEQDVIEKIFAMNGRDIEAERNKLKKVEADRDEYKAQLESTKEALAAFDGVDVENMKAEIEKLNEDLKAQADGYAAKEAERAFNEMLASAITSAGGKNPKAIMSMLDIEALKASKDQSADIASAIEAVKASDGYMFGSNEPHANPVASTNAGSNTGESALNAIRSQMGLPEK